VPFKGWEISYCLYYSSRPAFGLLITKNPSLNLPLLACLLFIGYSHRLVFEVEEEVILSTFGVSVIVLFYLSYNIIINSYFIRP